jgi:hypothetical protein
MLPRIDFSSIRQPDHPNEGRESSFGASAGLTAKLEKEKALECLRFLYVFFQKYNVLGDEDYYMVGVWTTRVEELDLSVVLSDQNYGKEK